MVKKIRGGVSRFQKEIYPKHQKLFEKLALEQKPEVLFITCADSRIDPIMLTQTEPGDLFICRAIGNIVPPHTDPGGVTATIEYAVGVLNVETVIICGHTDCGVIKGAINPDALKAFPDVQYWLKYAKVGRQKHTPDLKTILKLTERNVVQQLRNLKKHPTVQKRLKKGDLILEGWVYHIGTGNVTSYDPKSDKFKRV